MAISSKWELITLDKLGKIEGGRQASRLDNSLFEEGNIPLIGGEEVTKSIFNVTSKVKKYYNLKGLKQSKFFTKGKVLFIRSGNAAGDSAFLNFDACLTQNIYSFNSFKEISDPKFIKYCFDYPNIKEKLIKLAKSDTAQPNLTLNRLLTVKFLCPPHEIQQKIGDILSTYDELIENNKRQIEMLQNIRTSIFKEWFMNLRFPQNSGLSLNDLITVGGATEKFINYLKLHQLLKEKNLQNSL
ncbi:restriction endonuclease subunit S [Mycoplasma parvum]|uniref:Type I restriction modification DNA specificity domain-containing protein n=1 Tax=Mycoplasma parvum str. Indiana TaxID=1403316 RepID=U5NC11_9MOLU|nr:restriction endonuclease subunit S [Mycoplasma parvum]AGX88942.1 hypothetical protein PRV_00885 [Mycoplasma parvum str. Indiana]